MKKLIYYLSLPLVFAACSQVQEDTDNIIEYQAVTAKSQPTKVDGTVYPTDLPFVSFAFNYDAKSEWTDVKDESDAASTYIDAAEIIYDEDGDNIYLPGTWHSSKIYFWPKTDKLAFFSYSPSALKNGVSCTPQNGIQVTDYDVDSNPDVDFMVADVQADLEKQTVNNPVTTLFRHKLCQVYFSIISYKDNEPFDYAGGHTEENLTDKDYLITLKKIEIRNIYNKATYKGTNDPAVQANAGSWTPSGDKKTYTIFDGSMQVNDDCQMILPTIPNKYFMPQDLDNDAELVILYTVKHGETVTPLTPSFQLNQLGNGNALISKWDMNKIYTYNLRIDLGSNVITWAPEIVDWEDVDAGIVHIDVPNGGLAN